MFQINLDPTVYLKAETVAGVMEDITLPADVIRCKSATLKPLVADTESESEVKGHLGNDVMRYAGKYVEITLQFFISGSGAAGTPPPWAPIPKICSYSETVNALTDVRYQLVTNSSDTATAFVNLHGNRHPITGCKGELSRTMENNKLGYFEAKLVGVFQPPVAATEIVPDWPGSNWRKPLMVGQEHTAVSTLHGEAIGFTSYSYANNNSLQMVNIPGYIGVDVDNREPSGSITFPAPLVTDKNWYTAVTDEDTGPLIIQHGAVAGDIVRFENGNVQVLNPEPVQILGNIAGLKLDLNPMPTSSAGNNEDLIIVM